MLNAQVIQLPQQSVEHDHAYHQLILGVQGRAEFEVEGRGDLVSNRLGCLIPSSLSHAFCGVDQNEILVLNVPVDEQGSESIADLESRCASVIFDKSGFFNVDQPVQQLLQLSAKEMRAYPEDAGLARSFGVCLLQLLTKRITRCAEERRSNKRLNMSVLDAYIDSNLNRKMLVRDLALLACMSPSHFFSVFREEMGVTPNQYITRKRLDHAKYLLERTGLPLSDVSVQTGFSSQSAFAHVFKQYIAMTPRQYRLKH
ncbi:AraC family transcriptional regulator [Sedimenticola selenatireducens]|uniref:Helix-turn-helix domain-containing protein n=1 Tax=Sedimenticola selenatireducens TaxID=191960 RepID=A0A557SMU9_9GAMM|nr:AraC family transcriptional regulator [Sedimenticola selenatireducens]TVO78751.1 helix-turn-helix domain-containing protein [Sedimenticola selenatireducens]TVT62113.1 MAG: helix-turn-helix domain-containing protein [Sedimenticola selenatireducens]